MRKSTWCVLGKKFYSSFTLLPQEMFERIDKEEDEEVYLREVVEFLRVLDENLEQTKEVKRKTKNTDKLDVLTKSIL